MPVILLLMRHLEIYLFGLQRRHRETLQLRFIVGLFCADYLVVASATVGQK